MAYKRVLGVWMFFVVLAFLVLYNPLLHVKTHLPGSSLRTDFFHFHWGYWWIGEALQTPNLKVYETNYVMYPRVNNLAYHTMTPVFFPIWVAVDAIAGTVVAMDVIVLIELTLAGGCLFWLLRQHNIGAKWALVGGVAYQLAPGMILAVFMTNLNYLAFFWLPLELLVWMKITQATQRRFIFWGAVEGLVFYGMLLTDYSFFLYSAFLVFPYALLTLLRAERRRPLLVGGLLALAILAIGGWFAGPIPYILTFERGTLAPGIAEGARSIAFPDAYFSRVDYRQNKVSLGWFVLPVFLISLGVTLIRPRKDDRWFWAILTFISLILSAGAEVIIGGQEIPLPHRLLHDLTDGMFREPSRFGIVALVPMFIFVGKTWSGFRQRWSGFLAPMLFVVLLVESNIFVPMPVQPIPTPYHFYEVMGKETDDYVIVEIPNGAGSGETWVGELEFLELQYYGMIHHKRMINGFVARTPIEHFWYLRTDDPLLSWLGQRRYLDPDLVTAELRQKIQDYPIGYFVVHRDLVTRYNSEQTNQEIIGYFNGLDDLVCPVFVEGQAVVFRTRWHPAGCPPRTPSPLEPTLYRIDIGQPDDVRFLGWGWHQAENIAGLSLRWTGAWSQLVAGIDRWMPGDLAQAQVFVDLPPRHYTLTISAQAFAHERPLSIRVNGMDIGTQTVPTNNLTPLTFQVPAEAIGDGQHIEILLMYDSPEIPPEAVNEFHPRRLAVLVDFIEFQGYD